MKINGIRLNNNYIQVTQDNIGKQDYSNDLLYQNLEANKLNIVAMTLNTVYPSSFVSATIASKHFAQMIQHEKGWRYHQNVSIISIFPHHYSLNLLCCLLLLLGKHKIQFQHMISSNSMLTFIVDQQDCNAFIKMLSYNFDLPDSHAPFEQQENKELTQFLNRRYPETRATYVEKKIKTYGITLTPDLSFGSCLFSFDQLIEFGQEIKVMTDIEDKFFHASAHINSKKQINLILLTQKILSAVSDQTCFVDLLNLQGPHFGDRHSIISRALRCLAKNKISVLLTGCTGASISIILPQDKGEKARRVLMDIFEIP